MLKLAEQHVLSLEPYIPGRPIENDKNIPMWAKLASNENCLGASQHAMKAALDSLSTSHLYPNAHRLLVIEKICEHLRDFSVKPENIALGNGTSELIVNLVRGVLGSSEAMLFGWPSFVMYRLAAEAQGRQSLKVPLLKDMTYDFETMIKAAQNRVDMPVKLMIVANPNNPTGSYMNVKELSHFIAMIPEDVVLVLDEAYFEYVVQDDYPNGLSFALTRPRTVVLRTFSKVYGLAGLRLGYAVGDPDVINVLCRIRDAFNVNCVVQQAAIAALSDHDHVRRSIQHNLKHRPLLTEGLRNRGFFVFESVGNFVMARRSFTMPSIAELANRLIKRGVIIRPLDTYGLNDFMRVTVGTAREIEQLFVELDAII